MAIGLAPFAEPTARATLPTCSASQAERIQNFTGNPKVKTVSAKGPL